jgi:hypothetical protein
VNKERFQEITKSVRAEPFDSPFTLSRELVEQSKGERFAQDRLVEA